MKTATDPLAPLVDAIAARVVELLRAAPSGPTHYASDSLPPGVTPRAFLDACRSGELRASKVGRRWVATAPDVDSWIAARQKPATCPANDSADSLAGWTRRKASR